MTGFWDTIKNDPFAGGVQDLLRIIKDKAETSEEKTVIKFGTSGWRGVIGEAFTVRNVKIAVQAIIEMMKTDTYYKETGLSGFDEVRQKGIIIGRDTRFMGEDFVRVAAQVCAANEINAFIVKRESITPDLSLTVVKQGFAGSINITPSHNPFEYEGIKFNPSDGGTADPVLTDIIEQFARDLMQNPVIPEYIETQHKQFIHDYESMRVYINGINESKIVDLDFISKNYAPENITFIVDNVHGASYGYLETILSDISFPALRSNRDVLFGGAKPEPSLENLKRLFSEMKKYNTPLKLGVIIDPDGDRVRFMDGETDIDMNAFGAIAFHYLATYRGFPGGIAKSVATSNLVNVIANKMGRPVFETAVGFKNFRQYLKSGQAACAFEESDGITLQNHTLEKDGIIGALLALEITLRTGKNLGDYLKSLQEEYGYYFPKRFSTTINEEQKAAISSTLGKYQIGDKIEDLQIAEIITVDGYKFVFNDQSWLMIRPSGTEPKVRIYVESRKQEDAEKLFNIAKGLIA
ncbi:MAG: phosphomannomutase [Candidatus Margulisiibacteriota bacterium]